jgi:hypothetical protein
MPRLSSRFARSRPELPIFSGVLLAAALGGVGGAQVGAETRPNPAARPESRAATDSRAVHPFDAIDDKDPLRRMAARLARGIDLSPPGVYEDYSREFHLANSFADLRGLFLELRTLHGSVVRIEEIKRVSDKAGVFRLVFDKKVGMRMDIAIEGDPPRIAGVSFDEALPADDTREKALFGMVAFSGVSSAALYEIGDDGLATPFDAREDKAEVLFPCLPRLVALTALAEDVGLGKTRLDAVVALEEIDRFPAIGRLSAYPAGSPLTLHSLAAAAASEGDPTAIGALMRTLGKKRVVEAVEAYGLANRSKNLPFLTPREAHLLKNFVPAERAFEYGGLDLEKRLALLKELEPFPAYAAARAATPRFVETIGWYASTSEVCSLLARLSRLTREGPAAPLRPLLFLNRGLRIDTEYFPDIAYFADSEPGAIGTAWLLSRPDGRFFAFANAWNDPAIALDERRFFGWIRRYLELCAATL